MRDSLKMIAYETSTKVGLSFRDKSIPILKKRKIEEKIEIAKTMLRKRTDKNFISEVTGLSIEELNNLDTD